MPNTNSDYFRQHKISDFDKNLFYALYYELIYSYL